MGNLTPFLYLNIEQPEEGYHFSIDSFLLADFITLKKNDIVLDLGTGCGIIPILLAQNTLKTFFLGVEIQKELADIAKKNVLKNGLKNKIKIIYQDMKTITAKTIGTDIDFIISNPPYTHKNTGRISCNQQKAIARHEIAITLVKLIKISKQMLKNSGKLALIYPAQQLTFLMNTMCNMKIEPKRIRVVYPYHDAPAKLIMVEGVKNGRAGVTFETPLILYKEKNILTNEVKLIYKNFNFSL